MNVGKIALSFLILLCQIRCARATNLWFMPGDACFPVVLDKSLAEKLRESKLKMHLDYFSLTNGGYFCGYAGYNSIEIEDVPDAWSESIHEIYTSLRARAPRMIEQKFDADGKVEAEREVNGFLMFVQNGTFDVDQFQVGFRYNEDWMNDFPSAKSDSQLYQPYFTQASDVIEDWANAKHVAQLEVQFPEPDAAAETEFERRYGQGQMTGSAKDLMLVILPNENLKSHLTKQSSTRDSAPTVITRKESGPMIVLNANGVWLYRRDKKRIYRATPWKPTLSIDDLQEK